MVLCGSKILVAWLHLPISQSVGRSPSQIIIILLLICIRVHHQLVIVLCKGRVDPRRGHSAPRIAITLLMMLLVVVMMVGIIDQLDAARPHGSINTAVESLEDWIIRVFCLAKVGQVLHFFSRVLNFVDSVSIDHT